MNFLRTCDQCNHQFVCIYREDKQIIENKPLEVNEELSETPFYAMISCNYFSRTLGL